MHLSTLLHSPLLDRTGERLGRVEDVIVRLADGGYPPVTGLKARIGGRELFVPVDKIASLEAGAARLSGQKLNLGKFERREGEVLLRQDVLGRKLVNVEADPPRLVSAHEIELACIDGWWRVVGVDPSFRAQLRRCAAARRCGGWWQTGRSSTGPTWSRSSATCPPRACASPTASSPTSTRRRSPTWSRPPRTRRGRS